MQENFKHDKRKIYKRDILRDYALASAELDGQFLRFQESGIISFSILQGLIGETHSKGLLWHLKDTAHHLFGHGKSASQDGSYLDWAIGFLFHECMILLEASYQLQKYYLAAQAFPSQGKKASNAGGLQDPSTCAGGLRISSGTSNSYNVGISGSLGICDDLDLAGSFGKPCIQEQLCQLSGAIQSRLAYIIWRIKQLLGVINQLMCGYLKGEENNLPLARLIYDREDLLRSVFKELYEDLLLSIYGAQQEKALLGAAASLLESGHTARALRAAEKSLALNPKCSETQALLSKIAQLS